jgi:subtilisin family serine protease
MPTRRCRSALGALAVICALALGGAAGGADAPSVGAAGWQGLLGSRPDPQLGGRWIVVLRAPSLADRVRRAGGAATERQMRGWTTAAQDAQRKAIAHLWSRGAPVDPEQSYVRVINGFAGAIDPTFLPAIERDPEVAGVYPVRAAYPAALPRTSLDTEAFGAASGRRVGLEISGFDGSGVTVAQLDTGVDLRHPYLQGRLLPGIDILDADGDPSAAPNPTEPGRPERHGTGLAGLVVGVRGPAGLHGVAPGASLIPIRVAGWQPDADGGVSVYGRTDQVLAGLEAAVDPNADGDAHDAARVALIGVVEPFASFPDSPLARATRGALALGTLVVSPGGNDGPAGPGYGSLAGPTGAAGALAVAASDSRSERPTVHVLLRAGLRVLASGETALGGAAGPEEVVSAPVVALPRRQAVAVTKGNALDRLFDDDGYSRVAGGAVLLPSGPTTPEAVGELASAGARAVLVDGPIPAGSLGVDEPVQVPVVGVSASIAAEVRRDLAAGIPVDLGVGAAAFGDNPDLGTVAPFSSTGLALDGSQGTGVAAPGVGLVTSVPGRNEGGAARYGTLSGSSAAAAVVAGAAALLAEARPDLDASGLRGALVTSARRDNAGAEPGIVSPAAASAVELMAEPPVLGLPALVGKRRGSSASVTLRNVSRRVLVVRLQPGAAAAGVTVRTRPERVVIRPGNRARISVSMKASVRPAAPGALEGVLRAVVGPGTRLRIPWTAAVPVDRPVIARATLTSAEFKASDRTPAVLSLVAGRVDGSVERPQLLPLSRLEIVLFRGKHRVGTLVRLRDLLPGRYAFGVTGRGPRGARLPAGGYQVRILGVPVGGGSPTVVAIPFRLR